MQDLEELEHRPELRHQVHSRKLEELVEQLEALQVLDLWGLLRGRKPDLVLNDRHLPKELLLGDLEGCQAPALGRSEQVAGAEVLATSRDWERADASTFEF